MKSFLIVQGGPKHILIIHLRSIFLITKIDNCFYGTLQKMHSIFTVAPKSQEYFSAIFVVNNTIENSILGYTRKVMDVIKIS